MELTLTALAILVFLGTVVPGLYLLFRFRGTDFLFLFLLALLAVWLNRLSSYIFTVAESAFYLLWGVLASLAALLVWIPNQKTTRLLAGSGRRIGAASLCLLGILTLSNIAASETDAEFVRGIQASCYLVVPLVTAWVVVRCCTVTEEHIPQLVLSLLMFGTVIGVVGIAASIMPGLFRWLITSGLAEQESARIFTPMGGPSATVMCLLPIYCLAAGQLLDGRRRFFCAAVMAVCFVAVLTSLARAAAIAFVVGNVYLFADRWRGLGRRLVILGVVGLVVLAPLAFWLGNVYSLDRFLLDLPGRQLGNSLEGRLISMKVAFGFGAKHPWLGGGWGILYPYVRVGRLSFSDPTIIYLDGEASTPMSETLFGLVFAEGGLFALLALLWMFWEMWRGIRAPGYRKVGDGVVRGFRAGMLTFLFMSLVQDTLFNTTKLALYFYLFIFLGTAISAHYRKVAAFPSSMAIESGGFVRPVRHFTRPRA